MPEGWSWDETLFLGSAPYYLQGRPPYAPSLAATLSETLPLDGRQRVLDVGCGPGVLALELAPYVAEVVGIDPDAGMLAEAQRRAEELGITNASWLQLRAEEIPETLGPFWAVTFGQSFHWVDQPLVAARMRDLLAARWCVCARRRRQDAAPGARTTAISCTAVHRDSGADCRVAGTRRTCRAGKIAQRQPQHGRTSPRRSRVPGAAASAPAAGRTAAAHRR